MIVWWCLLRHRHDIISDKVFTGQVGKIPGLSSSHVKRTSLLVETASKTANDNNERKIRCPVRELATDTQVETTKTITMLKRRRNETAMAICIPDRFVFRIHWEFRKSWSRKLGKLGEQNHYWLIDYTMVNFYVFTIVLSNFHQRGFIVSLFRLFNILQSKWWFLVFIDPFSLI